jgi:hypothetical protein
VTCSEDACENKAQARGLCTKHYKAWQRAGKPDDVQRQQPPPLPSCSVAGCEVIAYSRGMCQRHYRQVLRTGAVRTEPTEPMGRLPCSVLSCDRDAATRGWCHGHYLRWRRTGELSPDLPLTRPPTPHCSVEGCPRPHQAQGYCGTHYRRLVSSGDPGALRPVRSVAGTGFVSRGGYLVVPVPLEDRWLTYGAASTTQHRLVMARSLGRPLRKDESVHHRNGDRRDNRLDNLELWSRFQPSGQRVDDKISWALEVLIEHAPHFLAEVVPTEADLLREEKWLDHVK